MGADARDIRAVPGAPALVRFFFSFRAEAAARGAGAALTELGWNTRLSPDEREAWLVEASGGPEADAISNAEDAFEIWIRQYDGVVTGHEVVLGDVDEEEAPPALEQLTRSRKRVRAGDVFSLRPVGHDFFFGRVVDTDSTLGNWHGVLLVYIYDLTSSRNELPSLDLLRPPSLLLPPVGTGSQAWTRGFFETVGHVPLEPSDLLAQHCFKVLGRDNDVYVDERGCSLEQRTEPVGRYAFESYETIGDEILAVLERRATAS